MQIFLLIQIFLLLWNKISGGQKFLRETKCFSGAPSVEESQQLHQLLIGSSI